MGHQFSNNCNLRHSGKSILWLFFWARVVVLEILVSKTKYGSDWTFGCGKMQLIIVFFVEHINKYRWERYGEALLSSEIVFKNTTNPWFFVIRQIIQHKPLISTAFVCKIFGDFWCVGSINFYFRRVLTTVSWILLKSFQTIKGECFGKHYFWELCVHSLVFSTRISSTKTTHSTRESCRAFTFGRADLNDKLSSNCVDTPRDLWTNEVQFLSFQHDGSNKIQSI